MPDAEGAPAWGRRALKLGTVAMAAACLVLAGLLVPWNDLLSSGTSSDPRPGPGGSLIGEAEGWVKGAAPSTNTIRVSSGFLGLSSVTLVVTLDTLIMVDGKEGGFDDLHEGRRVRADYEAHPNGLRAKSIEVLVDGARPENRRAIGTVGPKAIPPTSTVRPPTDDSGPRDVRMGGLTSPPMPPGARGVPGNPEHPSISPGARGVPGNPEHPSISPGARSAAGNPEHPSISPGARSAAGNPEQPSISPGARSAAGNPGPPSIAPGARSAAGNPGPPSIPPGARGAAGNPEQPSISPGARSAAGNPGPSSVPPGSRSTPGNPGTPILSRELAPQPSPRRLLMDEPPLDERRSGAPPAARNEGAPRAPSREGPQAQAADPGAVIDWLLKESPPSDQ